MTSRCFSAFASSAACAAVLALAGCNPPGSPAPSSAAVAPAYVPLTGSNATVRDPNSVPTPVAVPPNVPVTGFSQPNTGSVPVTGSAQSVRDPNAY